MGSCAYYHLHHKLDSITSQQLPNPSERLIGISNYKTLKVFGCAYFVQFQPQTYETSKHDPEYVTFLATMLNRMEMMLEPHFTMAMYFPSRCALGENHVFSVSSFQIPSPYYLCLTDPSVELFLSNLQMSSLLHLTKRQNATVSCL